MTIICVTRSCSLAGKDIYKPAISTFHIPTACFKIYPSETNIRTRPACRLNNRSLHKHSASHARWQRLINSLNGAFVVWLTFIERLCSDQLWLLLSDSHTLSGTDWNQFPMCSWIHNKQIGNERSLNANACNQASTGRKEIHFHLSVAAINSISRDTKKRQKRSNLKSMKSCDDYWNNFNELYFWW